MYIRLRSLLVGVVVTPFPRGTSHSNQSFRLPNCFTAITPSTHMKDIDPDTAMVAAGVVISLIAVLELYPAWRKSRAE